MKNTNKIIIGILILIIIIAAAILLNKYFKSNNSSNDNVTESTSDIVNSSKNISSAESTSKYTKISAEEANKMMNELDGESDYIILDVRTAEEFDEGHIPDALLIADYDIKCKVEQIIPNKEITIFVYCRSGNRSATAAKTMIEMGYTNVYDFGGIIDWPYEITK